MNNKNIVGNGSKATLPGDQKLSDKIQENKIKQGVNNNSNNISADRDSNDSSKLNNKKDNQNEEKKSSNSGSKTGTETTRTALKKAASVSPYTAWIPKGIRDKIVDKAVDSKLGKEAIEKQGKKLKRKMTLLLISIIGSILSGILMIAVLYAVFMSPISWVKDATKNIGSFITSFGNWFLGIGWCSSAEECNSDAANKYNELLDEALKKYNDKSTGCLVNEDLITATIFYGQIMSEKKDKEETQGIYFNYLDVSESDGLTSASSQVKKLVGVYFKGSEDADDSEGLTDYTSCYANARAYRQYLINTYIEKHYPSMITEYRTKEDIADEILKMGNIILDSRSIVANYNYCSSIAVKQENGDVETMELEEYVARVITNENNWHVGDNIENMKAQAVVARTYALNATNYCKTFILNSESVQTVADVADEYATKAAEETKNQILLKDGQIFSTQYDALAIASSDSKNYYLKQANLAIPKTWLDSRVSESEYEYYAKNNHGNGLSQWGSRYLQTTGKDYEEILSTFFSDAELGKQGGILSGGKYTCSGLFCEPAEGSYYDDSIGQKSLAQRRDYYLSHGVDYIYTTEGMTAECSWYAINRAMEIVYWSDMSESDKNTVTNIIKKSNANGMNVADKLIANGLNGSYNCQDVKTGSVISWENSGKFGHVGIVDEVRADGTIIISESWNNVTPGYRWEEMPYWADRWQFIHYQTNVKTSVQEICNDQNQKFKAYAYLLE